MKTLLFFRGWPLYLLKESVQLQKLKLLISIYTSFRTYELAMDERNRDAIRLDARIQAETLGDEASQE